MSARPETTAIHEAVRARYADRALQMMAGPSESCGSTCCSDASASNGDDCSAGEVAALGISPGASLGCGNPTALADLHPGEKVLDLGSGAGLDVLVSARRVAPDGHAYGVDMTDEMLAVARANQARAGVRNATFLKGTIEQVPLPDASVDVVISNCVINLAPDKRAVLREAFRLLRPAGRLAVADMVALEDLPDTARHALDLWAGCISGTITQEEYEAALRDAGFDAISFETVREQRVPSVGAIASMHVRARRPS